MLLETRLARCIAYRDEAMLNPIANRLYIEDLNLSIKMFSAARHNFASQQIIVRKGWTDD